MRKEYLQHSFEHQRGDSLSPSCAARTNIAPYKNGKSKKIFTLSLDVVHLITEIIKRLGDRAA